MIEFNGELTGKAKRFLLREQVNSQIMVSILVSIVFIIPILWAYFNVDKIFGIAVIPLLLLIVFSCINPGKKDQKTFMPQRVFVDVEEGTVVRICENGETFRMIDDVKTVEDYGEWYYFKFVFGSRDMYFVCQKSLTDNESLERFEELFKDKIVRHLR